MQSLQYSSGDYTSSIGNVSSVVRAGNACNAGRVSSIEQATVQVAMRCIQCDAGGGTVVVIDAASPV